MRDCHVTREYQRRGIDTVILENGSLRVEILAGKGGDVTELRDKRTDVNVLFEAPHRWRAPEAGTVGVPDGAAAFTDHYPGGWQSLLPAGGGPSTAHGASLALHGESPLIPFEVSVVTDTDERAVVELAASLTRYPFDIEREFRLNRGSSALHVAETVTNDGATSVEYSWLQHVALGRPLVGPAATLDVPCETVLTDPDHAVETARFEPDREFEWPHCETTEGERADLREFPALDAEVHDLLALTDLRRGEYTVTNPEIDLETTVEFPEDTYEYLWYWGAFGGHRGAPYFGRNYNLGLEPATSVFTGGLDQQVENGTAERLGPGETASATVTIETGPAESS